MRRLNDVSLSVKLFGILLAIVAIGVALSYFLTRQIATQEFAAFTTRQGRAQALMVSPFFEDYYRENGGWAGVEQALSGGAPARGEAPSSRGMMGRHMMGEQMMMGPGMWGAAMRVHGLLLAAEDGRVIFDPEGLHREQELSQSALKAAGTPIEVDGRRVGWLLPASAVSSFTPLEQQYLGSVNRAILAAGAAAAAVALLLGGLFLRQVTTPLSQLTAAADRLAQGDLGQRVPVRARDEVGHLAETFNEMATRLQHSEELRRRMIQDIAHELRTPLTVIQGGLQALLDGVYQPSRETIASVHEESLLLGRLIHDLRELSLAEAGELRLERAPTDLAELIREGARAIRPRLEGEGIALALELPEEPVKAEVDSDRIGQVLANLLSNAARHTPKGGRVTVSLRATGREAVIRVADTGPGIPQDDLPYLFERFFRGDPSRSRESGSGLGLAIAKQLVEAHGGRIWVESNEKGEARGATFSFALPLNHE